ncbi:hypothetical protein AAG906_022009 [Vitis piasezkii]
MGCQERRGVRVGEGQSLILKTSILKTKESGGKGGKALQWDSNSAPFEILRRVALWRAQYDEIKGEVQTRKGLRWIPRHPETRKGVVSDEMLRGVENKHRSGDSRIGQPFELLLNPWAGKRQPGELKHLSSQRKRKQKRFP